MSTTGVTVEIQLAGTWTDISQYVDHAQQDPGGHPSAVQITRGRQDELATSPTPQQVTIKAWNGDGRFCSKNPSGAYYPNLTRNTPLRVSIPGTTGTPSTFLQLSSLAIGAASAPDTAALDITGQIDVRVDLVPEAYPVAYGDYGPGTTAVTEGATLAAKWSDALGNASWAFLLEPNGQLSWRWSDGSSKHRLISGGQVATIPLGQRIAVRAVFVPSTGVVTFYTAPTMGGTFTVLSTATFGATTMNAGTGTPVSVGSSQYWAPLVAQVNEVQIYNSSAVLVADPVFSSQTAGTTSFSDGHSNTWTLSGIASIVTFGSALRNYRFYGQISSLPVTWDPTGNDVWATITASGTLRRLQQGSQPNAFSTMRRFVTDLPSPYTPVAYWPCEDVQGATSLASGIPGGSPMQLLAGASGPPNLASDSSFACSNPIPVINSSTWIGKVNPYAATSTGVLRFLMTVPQSSSAVSGASIIRAYITGGTCAYVEMTWATGGNLTFQGFNSGGTLVFAAGPVSFPVDGQASQVVLYWGSAFGITQEAISVMSPGQFDNAFNASVALTAGTVTSVVVDPNGSVPDFAIGHIHVQGAVQPNEFYTYPLNAWLGEPAGTRFARLCQENGIQARVDGISGYTVPMGYQTPDTLMNLLQACEDTDRGQIYEPRDFLGLAYRTLDSLTSQPVALTLDYNQDHMAPPLEPTDDDLYIVNDVTVTNTGGLKGGGSTAQATLSDGSPMSIGVIGDYQNSYNVSVQADALLPDEASWIMHAGTNNDERYPAVTIDLESTQPQVQAIAQTVEALDIGSYVQIVNTPSFLPPGPVNLLVWGYSENLGDFCNELVLNTIPEGPYEVLTADDAVRGRADTDGSTLNTGVNATATSWSVKTTNAGSPLWTTNAGDFPFNWTIDGEEVTVTNITGSSSPQTATVVRSVNGIVKSHSAGAAISLYLSPVAALTQ